MPALLVSWGEHGPFHKASPLNRQPEPDKLPKRHDPHRTMNRKECKEFYPPQRNPDFLGNLARNTPLLKGFRWDLQIPVDAWHLGAQVGVIRE